MVGAVSSLKKCLSEKLGRFPETIVPTLIMSSVQ